MDQREYEQLERKIALLEETISLKLTIVDQDGILRWRQSQSIFTLERASHQKNMVCRCGFCDRCIDNCRYRMNQICLERQQPFSSCCWKGVVQLVVPLIDRNFHYGMLYAGTWKTAGKCPAEKDATLPEEFYLEYDRLPVWSESQGDRYLPLLELFSDGLIHHLKRKKLLMDDPDSKAIRIHNYLLRHFADPIGLPDLAAELHLSVSYASVVVQKLFRQPFSRMLRKYRLDQAAYLLNGTDFPLRVIAGRCGFANEFHLSRVFKESMGVSPSDYRRRARKKDAI
ncbi:MAG: AraC family transcriptional regulator [Victivallaceae bacterium]|nr:AraC family transcriptional regulator [Victivallaceae bacterium]